MGGYCLFLNIERDLTLIACIPIVVITRRLGPSNGFTHNEGSLIPEEFFIFAHDEPLIESVQELF